MNISDEIKRLHELHQAGALSTAEFEQAKAKLLAASVDLSRPPGRRAQAGVRAQRRVRARVTAGFCAVRATSAGSLAFAVDWARRRALIPGSGA